MNFSGYSTDGFYDEHFQADGTPRAAILPLIERINSLSFKDLSRRQKAAESALLQMGITFNVYGDRRAEEKIWPFDIIPRIIEAGEWKRLEKGLKQRITALNLFVDDIYHKRKILTDGVIPSYLIETATSYREACVGFNPPKGIWIHITGTDLIRDHDGQVLVLEDNLRCPSGVSYVLENREILKKTFPKVFKTMNVRGVGEYSERLRGALEFVSPTTTGSPNVVLLTPGPYNSAYFEHAFLAQQLGITLVVSQDLVVRDDTVFMRTTRGYDRVDVLYRRIDDDFLDPTVFREDSLLGIPGIMDVYRKGNVTLANAPGTGIADDKCLYAYTPHIIKYYLGEDPVIPIVPTFVCGEDKQREHVLNNLDTLVVKAANLSGGYGMLIGPHSTKEEQQKFSALIQKNPRNYIAQPTIALSRAPTIVGQKIEGRHVDCRPYIVYGKDIYVLPGGLTRVALQKDSLVVNSSQGGGSKDTWVLSDETEAPHA